MPTEQYPYQNPSLSPFKRTQNLLSLMTIEEKIGQLLKLDGFSSYSWCNGKFTLKKEFTSFMEKFPAGTMSVLLRADWWTGIDWNNGITPGNMRMAVTTFQKYAYENSRLHIPLYIMEEASHGLMALGATVFPVGIALGAMWDSKLMNKIGHIVGKEVYSTGVQATHGPVLDVIRDIRWSRTEENYSEDPYQTSIYASHYIKGLVAEGVVPTLKHFCGHGSPEGGHNSAATHAGPIEMFNCQLRPFAAGINAGARSVMSSYNTVDGEAVTGSNYYLTELLRNKMQFDGFVVSDRGAIPRLREQRICDTDKECSALAVKAGCDVDNGNWEFHSTNLLKALKDNFIHEADIDRAVSHVLKLKFELGLFENLYPGSSPEKILLSEEHKNTSLEASRKCLTLLKNNGILPLKSVKRIAVIGPNADAAMNQIGDYSAPQRVNDVITPLQGLRQLCKPVGMEILYSRGCGIRKHDKNGFEEALDIASKSDVIIFIPGGCSTKYGSKTKRTTTGAAFAEVLGPEESEKESGEGTDRATLNYSGVQEMLFEKLCSLSKPIVVVPIQGRPLFINKFLERADAVLMAWYPGAFGGLAIAETLFGHYNPSGRLPVSFPRAEGQLPLFYNSEEKRQDYVDMPGSSLLPFGFGLSYTTFEYSDFKVEQRHVSVTVRNSGKHDGEEVVQFYLTDMAASIQRPCKELFAFERIFIPVNESRQVTCELTDDVLGYYDRNGKFTLEKGFFTLYVGPDSENLVKTIWYFS